MKKIWGLDIFRGLAAILVFCFHYWTFYDIPNIENFAGKIFAAGHLGVDIFFVLSGFLVSLSLFRYCEFNPPSPPSQGGITSPCEGGLRGLALKKYFSARLRRIVPLAVVVTLLFFIAKRNFAPENFLDFLAHIFFLQGFFQNFYHGINPVMWTLSVEMLFYILLPILYVFIAQKNKIRFLHISIFLVLLSFFWRAIVFYFFPESTPQEKIFLSEQLWGRFDQFFLGMVLAVIIFKNNTPNPVEADLCVCPKKQSKQSNHKGTPLQQPLQQYFPSIFLLFLGTVLLTYSFYTFADLGSTFRQIFWMQVFLHSIVGLGFFFFLLGFIQLQNNFTLLQESCKSPPLRGGFRGSCTSLPFLFLGKISYGIYLFHFPIISQISKFFPHSPLLGFCIALTLTVFISWLSWEFFEKKFLVRKKK